jgi:hypothetical protein
MTELDDDPMSARSQAAGAQPPAPPAGADPAELGEPEWPAQTARSTLRFSKPTAILGALVLLAGGFWGGITLEKDEGSSSSSGFAGLASAFRGARGGAGSGAGGSSFRSLFSGGSSNEAIGTVTDVIGKTLYVTSTSGSLVKVTLAPSTTITRNSKSTLSNLKVGDSVVVSGVKAGNGQLTASSISATAAGVSAGGGLAGLFGGGGGTGATGSSG